jgi:hypothetical protein
MCHIVHQDRDDTATKYLSTVRNDLLVHTCSIYHGKICMFTLNKIFITLTKCLQWWRQDIFGFKCKKIIHFEHFHLISFLNKKKQHYL